MKEGNYSPCQMANKRSISLYILDTRYKKRVGLVTSIMSEVRQRKDPPPCNDSECRAAALYRSGFLANLLELLKMLLANSKGAGIATAAQSSERASVPLGLAVR